MPPVGCCTFLTLESTTTEPGAINAPTIEQAVSVARECFDAGKVTLTALPSDAEAGIILRHGGRGHADRRLADDARQAGKRVLPMELGYCVGVDGTIDCWRPLWSEVRGGVIVEDTAAYEAWLQGLMASGTLPYPTPEQCRAQAEKLDNLCAMDPAKAGHSREVKAYERLRDAALRAAEAVPA